MNVSKMQAEQLEGRQLFTSFAAGTPVVTGPAASGIAVADVNSDGHPDLLVASASPTAGGVYVHLGDGAGNFTSGVRQAVTGLAGSVVAGDFNRDGKMDFAVAVRATITSAGSVAVFRGLGNGNFLSPTSYATGLGTSHLTTGDANGDGITDLFATNSLGGSVSTLLGHANGTFSPAINRGLSIVPTGSVVGDFNEDGKPDLAIASLLSLNIAYGNGDGTFGTPTVVRSLLSALDLQTVVPSVSDVNQDGHLDIQIPGLAASIGLLMGNGDGTFINESPTALVSNARGIATLGADFDNDGLDDIAAVDAAGSRVTLYQSGLSGDDGAAESFAVGSLPDALAAADLNGDNKLDLVVVNAGDSTVSIMLNATPGTAIGIFDPSTHRLLVTGTSAADTIIADKVGGTLRIKRNGVTGAWNDSLVSSLEIDGNDGDDKIDFSALSRGVYSSGGYGNDTVIGGAGNDSIFGSMGNDSLSGGAGNDRLVGGKNNDSLYGQAGNDRLYGQEHNDRLDGGSGNDRLWGGTGADMIIGGSGADRLHGGDGNDTVYGGKGNDQLSGDAGIDHHDGSAGELVDSVEVKD